MQVAIVKYGAGNGHSVVHALRRCGVEPVLTDDNAVIRRADRVVFPGQGEAGHTMLSVRAQGLDWLIPELRQPVLGICIGQQLMCARSEESGGTECIGIFPETEVRRFRPRSGEDKVPHMGWNTVKGKGFLDMEFFYFVHSFYVPVCEYTVGVCEYCGVEFSAAMRRDNFFATQFHPEKSGAAGERLLRAFLEDKLSLGFEVLRF